MSKVYKYVYTVKSNGIEFEVRANDTTEALSFAKVIAKAIGKIVIGLDRKEVTA